MPTGTSHAKRKIFDGSSSSALRLFTNEKILHNIKQCNQEEGRKNFQNINWCSCSFLISLVSLNELDATISLLYASGALAGKGLPVLIYVEIPETDIRTETIARDRSLEIMKYSRLDMMSTRFQRLQADLF